VRKTPIAERFWTKVERLEGEGCWLWTATRSAGRGDRSNWYGSVRVNNAMRRAHRVAWELTYGPIPDGLKVLHRCDTPPCVRPDHLFLGTDLDNALDRNAKGRWPGFPKEKLGIVNRSKTHCRRGHPYSGENLRVGSTGKRMCRICVRAQNAASDRRAALRMAGEDGRFIDLELKR
jgi:hypothetical protein